MDFIRELRLRQWARRYYVPAEERQNGWHPVVLEEMRLRDREIGIETPISEPPTGLSRVDLSTLATVTDPTSQVTTEKQVEIDFRQQPWGWTFVPLEPGRHWSLHAESSEIPRPHARKLRGPLSEAEEEAYLFVMD